MKPSLLGMMRGINRYGRASQGVRLMNLKDDDTVSAVALVAESETETETESESESETETAAAAANGDQPVDPSADPPAQ